MSGAANLRPRKRARTLSRVAAVQALFQSEQSGQSAETVIDQFVRYRFGDIPGLGGLEEGRHGQVEVALFARIVRVAAQQQDRLDSLVSGALPESWPLSRIDPVLRALMRAAACELEMADGPPARVVINEYLDVAHGFFSGDEPRLANGVLDRLAHLLRPAEFPAPPPG